MKLAAVIVARLFIARADDKGVGPQAVGKTSSPRWRDCFRVSP
jgi:hypothetical protein